MFGKKRIMCMPDDERLAHIIPFWVPVTVDNRVVQIADEKLADKREIYRQFFLDIIEDDNAIDYALKSEEKRREEDKDYNRVEYAVEHSKRDETGIEAIRVKPEGLHTNTTFIFDDYLNIRKTSKKYNLNCTELLTAIIKYITVSDNIKVTRRSNKFKYVRMSRGISRKLKSLLETQAKIRNVSLTQQITDILFDRVPPIQKIDEDIFKGKKVRLEFTVRSKEYNKRFKYLTEVKNKLYNYFTDKGFTTYSIDIPVYEKHNSFIALNKEAIEKVIYRGMVKPYSKEERDNLIEMVKKVNEVNKPKYTTKISITLPDSELAVYNKKFNGLPLEDFAYYFATTFNSSVDNLDSSVSKLYQNESLVETMSIN